MAEVIRHGRSVAADRSEFLARMKAQCYQIEQYRVAVMRTEGRRLSQDEAGMEWVERYAEAFARDAIPPQLKL